MRPIGFSTGAIAKSNFQRALDELQTRHISVVELSALRVNELMPLCSAIPSLRLSGFDFISVHAPSSFAPELESWIIERLSLIALQGFPVVVHPDTIHTPVAWRALGASLIVENMDKRKPVGRTVAELRPIFDCLPAARFCFDIGHARQVDPTMTEAAALLRAFGNLLAQVHLSEVTTASRHDPISLNAVQAFQAVAAYIPEHIPIILETLIDQGQSTMEFEMERARESLTIPALAAG